MNKTCTCKYVAPNQPMDATGCVVHNMRPYPCDECTCTNYAPIAEPTEPRRDKLPGRSWPRCICGHAAQQHNQSKR